MIRGARLAALLGLLLAAAGCNLIGPLAYFLGPQRSQKAEHVFAPGARVAVLVEARRSGDVSPVFIEELTTALQRRFDENKSEAVLLDAGDVTRLRAANPDFGSWSLQRVGRELSVDQVLYLDIDELRLREPGDPVLQPRVKLRAKVIAVDRAPDTARVWPADAPDRAVTHARPAEEALGPAQDDVAMRKLARDTAVHLAVFFFETDLETPLPVER